MLLLLKEPKYEYTLRNICLLFFPGQKITTLEGEEHGSPFTEEAILKVTLMPQEEALRLAVSFTCDNKTTEKTGSCSNDTQIKTQLAKLCFTLLSERTGLRPLWGTLTGIRPLKLYLSFLEKLGSHEAAKTYLQDTYMVSEEKLSLLENTAKTQQPVLKQVGEKDCSLYISIPFCPTCCSYCSFVCAPLKETSNLVEPHLQCLLKELELTKEKIAQAGFTLQSIYIGGGTPTTLDPEQLEILLKKVTELFATKQLREFTLEAGRPDTVDRKKLLLCKTYGITRLNINPQTLNDEVLQVIGRGHTAKEIEECFMLARELGFDNINMDIIAGLDTDTSESFKATVNKVIVLNPEDVTVHTLYMKRTSKQVQEHSARFRAEDKMVEGMVNYARETLKKAGYSPFYLYRQRNTRGNLENVGYSKLGYESPYNIWIMDESHTVFGCGAGAVSKLVKNRGEQIQRIFNYKLPHDYIREFERECEKKKAVKSFFEK